MNFIFKWLETWFNMYRAASSTAKPNFKQGFQVNGSDYTATELNTALGGGVPATAGTVTASKPVIVDSNKDVTGFRSVQMLALDIGSASGSANADLDIFSTTANKGYTRFQTTDNTGNTQTTITTAAMAAARTLTIPDPGATAANFALHTNYSQLAAAGSAYAPAASTEAVVNGGTVTFSGNTLAAGNVIRFLAAVKVGAINTTDTFTVRVRLGGVSGTVIASYVMGATTAANDVCVLTGEIDAASFSTPNMTFIGAGVGNAKVAGANAVSSTNIATAFTIDTTASTTLVVTGQFSTNSGTNSATLQVFNAQVLAS